MNTKHLIDYHLHTAVTVDGNMSESQACERAVQLGIREIAFTNHSMLTEPKYRILPDAFAEHWARVRACQERYPELTVRIGLEVDYYEGREAEIADSIEQIEAAIDRPLDLVLGSVHHLNGIFFSNKSQAPNLYSHYDLDALYHDYFNLATRAVRSRLFDVMAHPDLIKKFTGELAPRMAFKRYQDAVEPYLDALLDCNVGLEVNTKGYRLTMGEAYPTVEMLERYILKAGTCGKEPVITLGSDAHKVEDVGGFLAEGAALLRKVGLGSTMRFEKHKAFCMN